MDELQTFVGRKRNKLWHHVKISCTNLIWNTVLALFPNQKCPSYFCAAPMDLDSRQARSVIDFFAQKLLANSNNNYLSRPSLLPRYYIRLESLQFITAAHYTRFLEY